MGRTPSASSSSPDKLLFFDEEDSPVPKPRKEHRKPRLRQQTVSTDGAVSYDQAKRRGVKKQERQRQGQQRQRRSERPADKGASAAARQKWRSQFPRQGRSFTESSSVEHLMWDDPAFGKFLKEILVRRIEAYTKDPTPEIKTHGMEIADRLSQEMGNPSWIRARPREGQGAKWKLGLATFTKSTGRLSLRTPFRNAHVDWVNAVLETMHDQVKLLNANEMDWLLVTSQKELVSTRFKQGTRVKWPVATRVVRKSMAPANFGNAADLYRQTVVRAKADREEEGRVGGPRDKVFVIPRDIRLFLKSALGGMHRYDWRYNPRRRQRRKERNVYRRKRYVFNIPSGYGGSDVMARAIVTKIHQQKKLVLRRRRWDLIIRRPLFLHTGADTTYTHGGLVISLGTLLIPWLKDHVCGAKLKYKGSRAMVGWAKFHGPEHNRDSFHAVAVVFRWVARGKEGQVLQAIIMDPHGVTNYNRDSADKFLTKATKEALAASVSMYSTKKCNLAAAAAGVEIVHAQLPKGLVGAYKVQFDYEGSCSASSIAILQAAARHIATPQAEKLPPDELMLRIYKDVRDIDVVVAAQLIHALAS